VRSLGPEELRRALRVAATRLLGDLHATDPVQAQGLEPPIRKLADLPGVPIRFPDQPDNDLRLKC
jgi:hypothetical protein